MRAIMYACAVALLIAAAPTQLQAAQQSVALASISGRVSDPSGASVPGATVAARQVDTGVVTTAVTVDDGRFRLGALVVGTYEVSVHVDGFTDVMRTLTLAPGAAFDVPFTLALSGVDAAITVRAEAPVLDTSRTQVAATIPSAEIDDLPMNGRQFLDLALLAPGVAPANTAGTQLFPETSAVPGVSLSVAGQRNLSNNFVIDGLSANDDAAALSGMTLSADAIDQFQVVTSGGQAELGRALGGYINVVTRSGTNALHGTLYDFTRDDRLNAANALTGTTLPMSQWQYGGSLGGPVVANRTFFFGNVERRQLDQSGVTTIAPAAAAAIDAKLAAVAYPGPPVTTGVYPNPVDSTNALAKIDHHASDRDRVSVRYSRYDVTSTNSRGAGGLFAPSAAAALDNTDHAVAAGNTLVLASRTVLETRAQWAHANLEAPPADPIGPAVTIAGVATFGRLSNGPTARRNTTYEIVNNLSHQAGAHVLKAGADVLVNDDRIVFPRAAGGSYTFASLATFLAGVYNTAGFTQTFGADSVRQINPNVGVYAQDEWTAADRVTLNVGVRYDLQFLDAIRTDTNNVAPRLGAAWAPAANGRTVLRSSAGLFFDRVPLRATANALLSAGNTTDVSQLRQTAVVLSPGQAGSPVFPAILAAPQPSVTLPNLTTVEPRLQTAYSRQATVELEQQIGALTTVSVGYQYLRGEGLLASINQNVPTCVASGANNGCRPVAAYGNDSQYSAAGHSTYHGLHVSVIRRPSRWGHFRVSYTLSKAMNDVGEFFFSGPIDPANIGRDWGRSDNDQRHRLVVSGALPTLAGIEVSGQLLAYSALPLNVTAGVTTIQGTTARPLTSSAIVGPLDVRTASFIPRNSGTGPDFFSLNARVSRTFRVGDRLRLAALVEVFNLTNRANVVTMNGNFGTGAYPEAPSPAFRQVTAVGESRALQIGARLAF